MTAVAPEFSGSAPTGTQGLSVYLDQFGPKCLVLIAQDLGHWPVGEVAAGANHTALAGDYRLISLDFHRSAEREQELLQAIDHSQVSGCIFLWDHFPSNLDLYRHLVEKLPCVQVIDPKPIAQLDCILCDDYAGATAAVQHLLLLGYRQIGHLTLDPSIQAVKDRRQAYVDALTQANLPIERDWLLELPYGMIDVDRIGRKAAIRSYLTQRSVPRALFICADWLASEVVEGIQDLGLSIPKDIAIIGYDDALPYALTGIPLSTVQNDFRKMGRLAVERVIFRIENQHLAVEPCVMRISPVLVIRASSVVLTPMTERWDFIMNFIRGHFREDISVQQVANLLGLDPNYFSHHFKQVLGMRFTDLVQQLRLEYATQLLLTTNHTVENIAVAAGFGSLNHFYSLFKRSHGLSPHAFRKQHTFR